MLQLIDRIKKHLYEAHVSRRILKYTLSYGCANFIYDHQKFM